MGGRLSVLDASIQTLRHQKLILITSRPWSLNSAFDLPELGVSLHGVLITLPPSYPIR